MAGLSLSFWAFSISTLLFYRLIVHPLFISHLSLIPQAHFSSGISQAWILWQRIQNREVYAIDDAHKRCGPVIRLGPKEISINNVLTGVRIVYGSFEKDLFYKIFENYDTANMFSTLGNKEHSRRKRHFGNLFSKSLLQSSSHVSKFSQVVLQRLVALINDAATKEEPIEVVSLNYATAMDFISSYIFGPGCCSDFLRDAAARKRWVSQFLRLRNVPLWQFEIPFTTFLLSYVGVHLTPKWAEGVLEEVNRICLTLMKQSKGSSDRLNMTSSAVVLDHLENSYVKAEKGSSTELDLVIASELMDQLNAGADTTAITLTYAFYEISKHPEVQTSLRTELNSSQRSLASSLQNLSIDPTFLRKLDDLPVLDSVVMETLRLHPAVPGSQPRITPPRGATLSGFFVPRGIKVSAQAYSLHRNPRVFPEPEEWKPQRWKDAKYEDRVEMDRWFWGFGGGSRGCIGKDFAVMVIYCRWSSSIVDDEGIEQKDAYSAGPMGDKLVLSFKPVASQASVPVEILH